MWTPASPVHVARAVSIAALVAAPVIAAAPAYAQPPGATTSVAGTSVAGPPVARMASYAGTVALPDAELARLRGGMMIAGLDINFGAVVTVAVDGSQIAQTVFNLQNNGQVTGTTAIASALPSGITVKPVSGGGSVNAGNVSIQTVPTGTQGVVITNGAGQATAALASIGLNQTSSLLVNAASNQAVTQTVAAQLAINNYSQMLQGLQPQILASALTQTAAASSAVGLH